MRKIKNIDEYFIYIKKSICSLNNNEKNKIIKCINNANNKLKYINKDWFSGEKCIKIPWKIASITGKLYENGLPHTRNDIIIISKEDIISFINNNFEFNNEDKKNIQLSILKNLLNKNDYQKILINVIIYAIKYFRFYQTITELLFDFYT